MMRRIMVIAIVLVATLAVMAEDLVFLNNRRQWEKLPTTELMQRGNDFMNYKILPDSGLLCFTIVANRYNEKLKGEELNSTILAHCNVGSIYVFFFHNYTEAYKYLLRAKELAEKHHCDAILPQVLMTMGSMYWVRDCLNHRENCFEESLDYHKEAFWKAISTNQLNVLPVTLINLEYEASIRNQMPLIAREREKYKQLNLPDTLHLYHTAQTMNQGVELMLQGHPEKALEVFKQASQREITDDSGPNKLTMRLMYYSYIYLAQKMMGSPEALNTLMQHKELTPKDNLVDLAYAYRLLAEYYQEQGNQAMAKEYDLLWYQTADSVAHASQINNINTVRFLHEIDKMNQEHKELALKQQHERQLLWIVGAAALVAIVMLVLLYLSRRRIQEGYKQLYQQNVELLAADEAWRQSMAEPTPVPKYSHNQMDDDVMDELWQQIVHFMQTSDEIYQDSFNVDRLCDIIVAKREYVSQTINSKTGDSFSTLLNDYRIREACRRMNDTAQYGQYTVEGIAHSVGYSRSYFVRIFKEATGIPPSAYMKLAKAGKNDLYQPSIPVTSVP